MRTKEDNYIAKQLNSLSTLPKGYEANIGSKWEMIEMGLTPKRKKGIVFYWLAAACVLLAIMGAWWHSINNHTVTYVKQGLPKQEEWKQAKNATVATNKTPNKPIRLEQQPIYKQMPTTTVLPQKPIIEKDPADSSAFAIEQTLKENKIKINIEQPYTDTNTAITTTQTVMKKPKQRYYQMDFGEGTAIDIKQKSATSKLLQFKFSNKEGDVNSHPSNNKSGMPKLTQPL